VVGADVIPAELLLANRDPHGATAAHVATNLWVWRGGHIAHLPQPEYLIEPELWVEGGVQHLAVAPVELDPRNPNALVRANVRETTSAERRVDDLCARH
jgi:hypothetical protein